MISKLILGAGYLAIWPTGYALGVFVLLAWLLTRSLPPIDPVVYILLCAHSCYLLDRVKVADHRQDPADALALPNRAMLFARFAKPIRVLVLAELMGASLAGFLLHPLLAIIPLCALGFVHLYAGRQANANSPRLKDLPALKALFIASGHIALSSAVLWASDHDLPMNLTLHDLFAILGLWSVIVGDAILCDIDDHDTDKLYSTQSLAVMFGSRVAWGVALGLITLGSVLVALNALPLAGLGATLIISTALTHKNTNHRDLVDARLLVIVLFWIWISTL